MTQSHTRLLSLLKKLIQIRATENKDLKLEAGLTFQHSFIYGIHKILGNDLAIISSGLEGQYLVHCLKIKF